MGRERTRQTSRLPFPCVTCHKKRTARRCPTSNCSQGACSLVFFSSPACHLALVLLWRAVAEPEVGACTTAKVGELRFDLLHLVGQVLELGVHVTCVRQDGRRRQRVDPVLVPERVEQGRVRGGFKVGDVQLVVAVLVRAKVLNLGERHALKLVARPFGWLIALRVRPEGADLHFACGGGAGRIDDHSQPRLLELLVEHLRATVDA
eukprot:scaffold2325_cov105-Isochrysis_galbana.AAC.2